MGATIPGRSTLEPRQGRRGSHGAALRALRARRQAAAALCQQASHREGHAARIAAKEKQIKNDARCGLSRAFDDLRVCVEGRGGARQGVEGSRKDEDWGPKAEA